MAIATERVARRYLDVVANVAIPVDFPVFEVEDVTVYYGKASLVAVYNEDYTVTLDTVNFNTFTVTPLASLLTKINNLIAADPTETNFIVVRRIMDFLTVTNEGAVRDLTFLSRELDRTAMRFAQQSEQLQRAIKLSPKNVDQDPQIEELIEDTTLLYKNGKIVAGPPGQDVANAQANAVIALTKAAEAAASAASAALYDGPWLDTVAALLADTTFTYTAAQPGTVTAGDIIRTRAEGFSYEVAASGATDHHITTAGGVKLYVLAGNAGMNVRAFGAVGDGVADDTAAIQLFFDACEGARGHIPEGQYRIGSPVSLPSNAVITGVPGNDAGTSGTVILQFSQILFDQPEGLNQLQLSGLTFDRRVDSPTARTVCFALRSHQRCKFTDFRFIRYNQATIMERWPRAATFNTIDNVYSDWQVAACTNLDIAIGQEGYYYVHDGDGVTTAINTSISWPEQNLGSVVVLRENTQRSWTELVPGTDYTVSYPAGILNVTLAAAASATERIHIWPSQPRTDGSRRPISNNVWENIRVDYLFGRGHASIRWVDAETYRFERLLICEDFGRGYLMNPFRGRTGQGGDYAAFEDCVVSTRPEYPVSISSLRAFDFGPGSIAMSGRGIRMDYVWRSGETSYIIGARDRRRVALTGTVSGTSGAAVVTGTGTVFTSELTKVGATADLVEIDGVLYAIASIDSGTQITLSTNLTTSPDGSTAYRVNVENGVDALMDFASMGDGFYSNRSWQSGRVTINSLTERSGQIVILNGATFATVTHGLRRAPKPGELTLTAHSVTNGRTLSVSDVTATTFRVNVNSAAAADYTIGWRATLMSLN